MGALPPSTLATSLCLQQSSPVLTEEDKAAQWESDLQSQRSQQEGAQPLICPAEMLLQGMI